MSNGKLAVSGVKLDCGTLVPANAVVLTTGTFLRGEIHVGNRTIQAGRQGDKVNMPYILGHFSCVG